MGTFHVEVTVKNLHEPGRERTLRLLADTGATYTLLEEIETDGSQTGTDIPSKSTETPVAVAERFGKFSWISLLVGISFWKVVVACRLRTKRRSGGLPQGA